MQEPERNHLLKLLDPEKSNWRSIGEQLGVRDGDIQSLQYRVLRDETKLSEVLWLWTNQRKLDVCWKTIITVIENPPINNVKVAKKIYDFLLGKYNSDKQAILTCQGLCTFI